MNKLDALWQKIAWILSLDSTWRLVDAYSPRVFGLLFQTFLIAQFGAGAYALPGWALGTFGLVLAVLPDPHSYILVRASGDRAHSLYALTVPSVLLKVLAASGVLLLSLIGSPAYQIVEPYGSGWHLVALAALFYGSTEFLWAILGTISLANGRVRRTAQTGILARLVSVLLLFAAWMAGTLGIGLSLALATAPVFIVWVFLSPISMRWSRVSFFFVHSVIRYAGWLQGIALITAGLFQMPLIVLGMWSDADPVLIGTFAFVNRLLMAGFQPFQILQSVVIRDASRLQAQDRPLGRTSLWIVFKAGGLCFAFVSLVGLAVAWWSGRIEPDTLVLAAALSVGVATSIWHRHELAVALATHSARRIFLGGYVPTFALTVLGTPLMIKFFGIFGLSAAVVSGWIWLSNSWRWAR